ncbi:putative glycolipid-binding domain-containing protein, partial [Nonomuraea sp. NPDC003201]
MTTFTPPPDTAAWRHLDARTGFEVVYFRPLPDGHRVEGCTTAVEEGFTWVVDYVIELDASWPSREWDDGLLDETATTLAEVAGGAGT